MAQCKLTAHEFIQNTFSPMVAVMCSPMVNQICQKNNLSFIEMVQPFCKIHTEAYIRDPSGTPVQVKNLRISMQDVNARPPEPLLARKFLNESVSHSYSEKTTSFQIGANENIDIPSSVPWFDAWRETFLQVQFPSDHEFTKHFIACVLVVSTAEPGPAEALQRMGQELQRLQSVTPAKLPKWFGPGALRYHVLLHDPACCEPSAAELALSAARTTLGDAPCCLLPVNSRAAGPGEGQALLPDPWSQFLLRRADSSDWNDHDSSPRTPAEGGSAMASSLELGQEAGESTAVAVVHHPLSPECGQESAADEAVANNVGSTGNHVNSDVWAGQAPRVPPRSQHGACLTSDDLERLRAFVQDFCTRALLPHVEQQIQQFSDLISNKKGMSRSLFSATKRWFGSNKPGSPGVNAAANAVVYTSDAPELQLRRLGDLCFMFGLHAAAFQAYHSAKRDFGADQAWLHYAGALEMASLAAFMQGEASKKTQDYMEEAILTYLNSCRMQQFATRATLLSAECLKARGLHAEAARQLTRMTSEDSDLRSALLLEQAALCFLRSARPRSVRKHAFHAVLAGHRFSKAGQRRHSRRCYRQALQVFEHKNWGLAEDHIHYTIGRTALHLKQVAEAAQSFARLLHPGSCQPAAQQASFLREYLAAQLQLREEGGEEGGALPVLPLPVIVGNSVRVLVGPLQSQLPRDPAPGRVPASGVLFSDDCSDDTRWRRLEELLVTEAEGALPMVFRPTVHLFTSATISASRPVAVVGEPVFACASLRNPLHISLMLRNVFLLWEFASASARTGNETSAGEACKLVDTQVLETFVLRPDCTEDVVLCVTPTVVGTLHLRGVAYSIANLAPPAPSEAGTAAPQLVPGKQLFALTQPPVKSPRDKASPEEHLRLELTVVPSAPCLQVVFAGLPTEMLCGELRPVTVELTNTGSAPLSRLLVAWSLPESFSLEERPRPALGPQPVARVPLPGGLAPGATRAARLWLRAPDTRATALVHVMFYYENNTHAVPRYRLVRHSWQLSVLSSVEVSVTARRSRAPSRDEPRELLNLALCLKNSNQVHDPVMTEVTPVQLSVASRTWRLVDTVFIPRESMLQSQESVHFLAKACRRGGGGSSDSLFSDVVLGGEGVASAGESPYSDFYHHHFPERGADPDGDTREEAVDKLETALSLDLVVIVRWQAAVESGAGVRRTVIGQHHVRLERLEETSSWPRPPAPARPLDPLAQLGRMQHLVVCTAQHAPCVTHDFSRARICVVPVVLSLQNCCDSLLAVKVSSVGCNAQPGPGRSQLYSPHCPGGCRWVGPASCSLELPAHASRSVQLRLAVAGPGTFGVGAGLEVRCGVPGAPEADHVAQAWRARSSLVVRDASSRPPPRFPRVDEQPNG
ncbi:trafficking protein particle complex subunit 8 [Bacillus rossius redtenbacheri]|uniref:trafficking protein particle complex subunit 8 n=1 Tax=Bacillus rossius redtenbacheri TaxID=93214 RepID=UPI002FDC7FF4